MTIKAEFEKMIAEVDADRIHKMIHSLPLNDVVRMLLDLREKERDQFFRMLSPDDAAWILRAVPKVESSAVITPLPDEDAVRVLENLDSHQQADILHHADVKETGRILQAMDAQSADHLRRSSLLFDLGRLLAIS